METLRIVLCILPIYNVRLYRFLISMVELITSQLVHEVMLLRLESLADEQQNTVSTLSRQLLSSGNFADAATLQSLLDVYLTVRCLVL